MTFASSGMVRYSAQSESAFQKNFNPNNPPPFQTSIQVDPNLTRLYGYLAGSIAQEIELRRRESAPRMYLFNKMGVNGYVNQDFKDLVELAIRYSLVLFFIKRESQDWQQIVDKAAKDAVNMVIAALILTNQDLRSQFQPQQQEMAYLHNIFNFMQQVEQDAQTLMNSIQNQMVQNPTMMNPNMMGSPVGGMGMGEPTVNVPGFGQVPLSVYNQMVQAQQNRPGMPQMSMGGYNPMMGGAPTTGYNPVNTGFNPAAMGNTFPTPGMGISPNVARQLVSAPAMAQAPTHAGGMASRHITNQYGLGEDDDWHEGGTQFSGGVEIPAQPTPFVTSMTQGETHSASPLTTIANGKELYNGKPVYRIQGEPDYFYADYDGSLVFKPSAKCPAIPAANMRKSKRMYRIHQQTGEFTVVLVGLTDQEKMDIEKHLILIEDEDQRERMRALMLASRSEPIEIRPTKAVVTVQGEISSDTEGEVSEPVVSEPEPIEVPSYGHALNVNEVCISGVDAQHTANAICIASQGDMPAARSTVGEDYEILIDRTSEGVVNEFITKAAEIKTLAKLAKFLDDTMTQATNSTVQNWSLIEAVKRVDAKLAKAINRRLQCQLGVDVKVGDFYRSYADLVSGMESHYGIVIAEALRGDEAQFIQSIFHPASEVLEAQVSNLLELQIEEQSYSVGSFALLVSPRSITQIEATLEELTIDFGENSVGVQIEQAEFPVLFDLCTKMLNIKLDDQPVFDHVLRTLDGQEIFFTRSAFNAEAVIVQLNK